MGLFICGNNLALDCLTANLKLKKIHEDHNPEVAGSNPTPATMKTHLIDGFFVYRHLRLAEFEPTRPYFIKRIIEVAKK